MTDQKISPKIESSWLTVLQNEFKKPYFQSLKAFLKAEKKEHIVYPPGKNIFAAFNHTPFEKVKVVIIGQDPYHGPNQANGLSFSVNPGVPHPPSLRNIFKELSSDLSVPTPVSGDLTPWARQGVLMLNATLTVRKAEAGSHQNKGWEIFTDEVIKQMSERKNGLIFILWGGFAQKKIKLIDTEKHHIIKSPHPSPLSSHRGFFGSKPFSKANALLEKMGQPPIKWQLD